MIANAKHLKRNLIDCVTFVHSLEIFSATPGYLNNVFFLFLNIKQTVCLAKPTVLRVINRVDS